MGKNMEKYIPEKIAPHIKGDGGWVEFISFKDDILTLSFRAECSKCIVLDRCCDWIRQKIKADLGMDVKIQALRNRPYFWEI